MSGKFSLDDYVDVAERIQHFTEKYPDGSLQTLDWKVRDIAGQTFVVYRAAAYRTPDDKRPGHGTAWEPFPGKTPYTKDSELMNAETAAWGRAIVALGLASNRKIASRQEVKARQSAGPSQNKINDAVKVAKEVLDRGILDKRELMTQLKQAGATDKASVTAAFASLAIDKFDTVLMGLYELLAPVSDVPSTFDAADPVDQGALDDALKGAA